MRHDTTFIGKSQPSCPHWWLRYCASHSERTMDLVLEMCNTRSIHWCGVSGRQLGKLSPAGFLSLPLTLLSSIQGLQVPVPLGSEPPPFTSLSLTNIISLPTEHIRTEAHRHVPEEDVWIRRHRTSVCGVSVHRQRVLGVLLTLCFFGILDMNGPTVEFCTQRWHFTLFATRRDKTVF